ncbi:transposable element Tcb1 transposase [Trichonephila clavipes]|nr:transposable element Tcb1 transposase [Trichonephila clavipes]
MKEGCGWQNGMKLSLLTSNASVCNTYDGRIRVWRHRRERMLSSCVMHHHTGLPPSIMVWSGIGYHSRTLLGRIAAATPDQLWQRVEAAVCGSAVPQEHIQSLFESMPRRVAAVISNNGGYSGY